MCEHVFQFYIALLKCRLPPTHPPTSITAEILRSLTVQVMTRHRWTVDRTECIQCVFVLGWWHAVGFFLAGTKR